MEFSLKRLFKGTFIYLIANMLPAVAGVFLIPIYTRFLSTEQYGILGILTAIISCLGIFLGFGLNVSQIRYHVDLKSDREKLGRYIFSINIALLLCLLAIYLIMFSPIGHKLFSLIIQKESITFFPYVAVALGIIFFAVFREMASNYFVAEQKFKTAASASLSAFILSIPFVLYFIIPRGMGALGMLLGQLIGGTLAAIIFYYLYIKNVRFGFELKSVKGSFAIGGPIMMNLIIGSILLASDRVILGWYVSLDEVGIYTVALSANFVLLGIIHSFNIAWIPDFYQIMRSSWDREYHFRRVFYLALVSIGGICLFGQLWAKEIIYFLTPSSYHPSSSLIPILLFGMFLNLIYHFFANVFVFHKQTRMLPVITAIAVMTNVGLNLVLIPRLGVIAAAYTTVISYMISALLTYILCSRMFVIPSFHHFRVLFLLVMLFNPLLVHIAGHTGYLYTLFKITYLGFYAALAYFLFRDYLRQILQQLVQPIKNLRRRLLSLPGIKFKAVPQLVPQLSGALYLDSQRIKNGPGS
jgi:O-antigen/teichoic acid export membrane protein